jgi:KTSC domain
VSKLEFSAVESSNIESIAHDPEFHELHVKFKNGGHYVYSEVDLKTFGYMKVAESVGKFLNQNIKNLYPYRRMVELIAVLDAIEIQDMARIE